MADEKIIKIVAQVDSNQGPSPESIDKAALHAQHAQAKAAEAQEEARRRSLLSSYTIDNDGTEHPVGGSGSRRGRGRPRRTDVPPPPPRGKAGAPPVQGSGPNDPDSPTSPEGQSRFAKAWKIFQKGVTAVNGANGHLTKSVAFVTRGFEFASETAKDLKASGITASGALNAVKGTGTAAAGALRMSSAAAAAAGTAAGAAAVALGVAGIAVVGFTLAVTATSFALKVLIGITNNMTEVVGKFSASLEAARANNKVLEIQARMRSANRVGGDLASLEGTKGGAERAIIDMKTSIVDLLAPFMEAALTIFTNILKTLNIVLALLNVISEWIEYGVEKILAILSHIPIIGGAAKKALNWMEQDERNNIKAAKGLHEQVENLFQTDSFFDAKVKKNMVAGKFLP